MHAHSCPQQEAAICKQEMVPDQKDQASGVGLGFRPSEPWRTVCSALHWWPCSLTLSSLPFVGDAFLEVGLGLLQAYFTPVCFRYFCSITCCPL